MKLALDSVRPRRGRRGLRGAAWPSARGAQGAPSPSTRRLQSSAELERAHIERVVFGLLDNAIKFGERKPIEVSVRRDGRRPRWRSAIKAVGIPADRLTSIFAPFERAVPKEHFGGLGLGLYVAKAIVEAHGGSIGAQSRVGEGTTLVVRLPLSR